MRSFRLALVCLVLVTVGALVTIRTLSSQWLPALLLAGGGAVMGALELARRMEASCRLLSAAARRGGVVSASLAPKLFLEEFRDVAFALGSAEERSRRSLETMEEERLWFERILASLPMGVLVLGRDGGIRYANPPLGLLLRDTPREGQPFQRLVRDPGFSALLEQALEGEEGQCGLILRGEDVRYLAARAVPAASGGALAVLSDVTERHLLEEAKKAFIADAGHELQTPLAVVRAAGELLLEAGLRDEQGRVLVVRILEQQERMSDLVDDMLLLSRLEAESGFPIDTDEAVDLAEVVRAALEETELHPLAAKIAWDVELPEAAPFRGWREGLVRSVRNLLDNAVKYTRERFNEEEGGRVSLRLFEEKEMWCIAVEDNGVGIPARLRERIFERFHRGDASRTRQAWGKGGYGLGLSIVKRVMDLHRGQVRLAPREEGSLFLLLLPFRTL